MKQNLAGLLEKAFWYFDALHKAHYRDVAPNLPGPMTERDAFASAVRDVVLVAPGARSTQSLTRKQVRLLVDIARYQATVSSEWQEWERILAALAAELEGVAK